MLFAAGGTLAIVQPGSLGGDDETVGETTSTTVDDETSTTVSDETSTTVEDTSTTSEGSPTTLDPAGQPADTTAPGGGGSGDPGEDDPGEGDPGDGTTSSTIGGSGIAGGGTPSGGAEGIADTGQESLLGAGLVLAALGLALRRLRAA